MPQSQLLCTTSAFIPTVDLKGQDLSLTAIIFKHLVFDDAFLARCTFWTGGAEQGSHAALTKPMPTLSLLRVAQHQAALLTLILVFHCLHKLLLVAALLWHKH